MRIFATWVAQALFSSNNKNAVNYDRLLSRRFFGEELFSSIYKRLPLFLNLWPSSGTLLLTRAKSRVAFRTLDFWHSSYFNILYDHLRISSHLRNCIFESHMHDFHRKESDSVIERRLHNDVTFSFLLGGKEREKVDYYFMKIHSYIASCQIIIIPSFCCVSWKKFLRGFPPIFFSFHRRDIRNSLKRIQMTSPLWIFMLPADARTYWCCEIITLSTARRAFICRRDRNASSVDANS